MSKETRKLNFGRKAYQDAIMEDCIMADLGYTNEEIGKDFVNIKSSELTVRNLFEKVPFNCRFCPTNDGMEVGIKDAEMGTDGYCLVYVSFLRVISFDFDKTAVDEVEMWHFVNDCLIDYFFK